MSIHSTIIQINRQIEHIDQTPNKFPLFIQLIQQNKLESQVLFLLSFMDLHNWICEENLKIKEEEERIKQRIMNTVDLVVRHFIWISTI